MYQRREGSDGRVGSTAHWPLKYPKLTAVNFMTLNYGLFISFCSFYNTKKIWVTASQGFKGDDSKLLMLSCFPFLAA